MKTQLIVEILDRPFAQAGEVGMLGRPQCAHLGLAGGRTHKGRKLVVCLLDRQPVIPEIADCDRYEPALPKTLQ